MISCFKQLYKPCQGTSPSPFHKKMHGPEMGISHSTDPASAAAREYLRRVEGLTGQTRLWEGIPSCQNNTVWWIKEQHLF